MTDPWREIKQDDCYQKYVLTAIKRGSEYYSRVRKDIDLNLEISSCFKFESEFE